jgi:hypothetical protein
MRNDPRELIVVSINLPWNKKFVWSALVLFAIYFPVAWWLKVSYVPWVLPPGAIRLVEPFRSYDNSKIAFVAVTPALDDLSDFVTDKTRSPLLLYENRTPLGPAHSIHVDIVNDGQGRFSHWKDIGIIFSASDNTDPNTTGRRYWVVRQ